MATRVFSPGELASMRAAQTAHMGHEAEMFPWTPAQDPYSGQTGGYGSPVTTQCGVDYSARGATVEMTEGTVVANYRIRLPLSLASVAKPLSRYQITAAYDMSFVVPDILEQVSEPSIGATGLVVWARNVSQ